MRKKFCYRKQVQRLLYEKAVLLWKRKFYYKNQKFQRWDGSSILEKEFYCEKESLLWKKGVYNQTEVLLRIEISIRENNSIIRSSAFFG